MEARYSNMVRLLVLLAAVVAVCARDESVGHLLALKKVDLADYYTAVGNDVNVTTTLYNVGNSPVFNVNFKDEYPVGVEIVAGEATAQFDSIGPNDNRTVTLKIKPGLQGQLAMVAAKMTYQLDESADDTKTVYSNILPALPVLQAAEYQKRNARHFGEIATFVVLAFIPVGLPYYVYQHARGQLQARRA
eukprot:NODE_5193_length_717_cov_199.233898_g5170_i0.p1 GENE.NODE_5193_length_717_cov_199.233898_g5170_i0~~NODE_5193_length_717_cov_199.233898_g5170_i0.p1  ORF type:complete len:199 (-),score=59.30 NODE_5193_length_717_cov_199.233898_g5170_i0:119-688(-)